MVYVHLAEGFEEIEAITVIDVLRRGNVNVQTVSVTNSLKVKGTHGIEVSCDVLFKDADYQNCEMIVLPGGMPGTTNLLNKEELCQKILEFNSKGKYIAAICAAPLVLGHLGILENKAATIYPGMEKHLQGAKVSAPTVVVDGNIITSKGPGTAMEFALALVATINGSKAKGKVAQGLLYK